MIQHKGGEEWICQGWVSTKANVMENNRQIVRMFLTEHMEKKSTARV